jgi:GT2 family glycosyltransferase
MRASVIVVSYNSLRYLPACLSSICSELEAYDELIVVDNGSSDGSAEFVATRYPRARLIRARNTGYAGGNNMGAAAAGGEMLVFLNPDIILRPGALPALLAPLSEPGNIALTTACLVHMGRPEVINTCGNTMHYTGLTYCRGAGQPRAHYQSSTEVDAVSGAAFAIRRTVFERLGGFDERFFMYVEDSDLSWRARLAGYRCLYVPGAIVEHAYVPAYSLTKAFYLDRNRHLMLLKNLSRMSYARLLPGLLLAEAVTWGFLLLKGPRYWSVKLRVYRWLWTHRRTIRTGRESRASRQRDREIAAGMAYRLEFGQLANPYLSRAAALFFHPTFWLAHLLFAGPRFRRAPLRGMRSSERMHQWGQP